MTFAKEQLNARARFLIKRYEGSLANYPDQDGVAMDLELARMALAGMEADQKGNAAEDTLESHGFTWSGGQFWKPPLGLPPAYVSNERAELENYRNAAPVSFDDLRDAVAEVSGGPAMEWSDIYKGHQAVPFINFNSLARIVDKFRSVMQPIADMDAQLESARLHIAELEAAPPAPVGDGETPVPLMPDFPGRTLTQRECYRAGFEAASVQHGWVAVHQEMPPQGEPLLLCTSEGVVQRTVYGFDGENWLDWYELYDPVKADRCDLWQPLPAAPQQEVKP